MVAGLPLASNTKSEIPFGFIEAGLVWGFCLAGWLGLFVFVLV